MNLEVLPPPPCGVYFLCRKSEVVYVGQSANIPNRVRQHRSGKGGTTRRFDFDDVYYLECQQEDLNRVECDYIQKLMPAENKSNATANFEEMLRMREAGESLSTIAKHFGASVRFVFEHFKSRGVPAPEKIKRKRAEQSPRQPKFNVSRMLQMREAGNSISLIAHHLGASIGCVNGYCKKAGIATPEKVIKKKRHQGFDLAELLRLRASGKSYREIGAALNISSDTAYRRCKRHLSA